MNARATLKDIVEALPDDLSDEGVARIADFIKLIRDQEELRKRNWLTTVEAMEAARRGELVTVEGVDGLMAYLHAAGDDDADD